MSRPRNMLVSLNGKVVSVPPSKLKASLASLASGGSVETNLGGKELGSEVMDLSDLTSNKASELLSRLFPVTAPVATPVTVSPAITEIPTPIVDF